MASTRTDAPPPLSAARLGRVAGVLGRIARERAADYADAAVDAVDAGAPAPGTGAAGGRFAAALAGDGVALIAEVKRASPSRGAIADLDPVATARAYADGGAAALSVLTEPRHFGGDRAHLRAVSAAQSRPTLRKDFVVHPAQLREARGDGASAALLIVAVLGDALAGYLAYARSLGLDALVEVHDDAELDLALAAGADLVGVNNRDLTTLDIDLATSPRLIERGRASGHAALWVAESGYAAAADVAPLIGVADAVLVGSSLAASDDVQGATRALVAALRPRPQRAAAR